MNLIKIARLDIINIPGKKTVNYYINGELLYTEDTNIFREGVFDVGTVYISSNSETELNFMAADIMITPQKVVKRLFPAGLTAGSCSSLQTGAITIW
ncbi:MAG: hypothetical protein PHG58_02150 [Clostridia bacterium]|nr:hypothetical protein [Clostridia bacterium]